MPSRTGMRTPWPGTLPCTLPCALPCWERRLWAACRVSAGHSPVVPVEGLSLKQATPIHSDASLHSRVFCRHSRVQCVAHPCTQITMTMPAHQFYLDTSQSVLQTGSVRGIEWCSCGLKAAAACRWRRRCCCSTGWPCRCSPGPTSCRCCLNSCPRSRTSRTEACYPRARGPALT